MKIGKQKIIIILVGLVGCFLTSLTGSTVVMLAKGWDSQGGFSELIYRLSVGYSASSVIVFLVFPFLIPKLTTTLEKKLKEFF
jgi:hypothetical protein